VPSGLPLTIANHTDTKSLSLRATLLLTGSVMLARLCNPSSLTPAILTTCPLNYTHLELKVQTITQMRLFRGLSTRAFLVNLFRVSLQEVCTALPNPPSLVWELRLLDTYSGAKQPPLLILHLIPLRVLLPVPLPAAAKEQPPLVVGQLGQVPTVNAQRTAKLTLTVVVPPVGQRSLCHLALQKPLQVLPKHTMNLPPN